MHTIQIALLWTDILFFLILIVGLLFFVGSLCNPQTRETWKEVFKKPATIVSSLILATFLIVGVLDSLHFHKQLPRTHYTQISYSPHVYSVLDLLLAPLNKNLEKTYSAPFALHAYVKEFIETPHGKRIYAYPRLKYAVSHLRSQNALHEILRLSLKGMLEGLFISGVLFLSALLASTRGKIYRFKSGLALLCRRESLWFFATASCIILIIAVLHTLSTEFHILGTDKVGQDLFYSTVKSIRTGLIIGTVTTLLMIPFALGFGILAGFYGGIIDDIIQYIYTTVSSIPGVLLIAASVLSMQLFISHHPKLFETFDSRDDARLLTLCIILGITGWTGLCRILRAETLKLREIDFIQASIALGMSHMKIIWKHIIPNVMPLVLITVVLDFSGLVLAEAVLSYVGVGVAPTTHSWGNMINSARLELAREPVVWWPMLSAFSFMFALVLSCNIFADRLRDAFDPRLKR